MKKEIYISVSMGESRIAITEDGTLVEVYVEKQDRHRMVGNIYKGQVENVLPGMQAAFVDIGYDINYLTNYDNHIPKHKFSNIISKCDFIIDQYVPSRGIIALTGLEAMLLGVNVISSLNKTGVEDSKLLNLVNNFYKEDGLLYFNLNKKSPQILKNYVIQHHSGEKTLDILRDDNII